MNGLPDRSNFDTFYKCYSEVFVPAYSDLTGYLLFKPIPILHSIENAFSHVMQCCNPDLNDTLREENIKKANHHLERATLDCYKILFVKIDTNISSIVDDSELRKFAVNVPERDFLTQYFVFKQKIRDIRLKEIQNIGVNLEETIVLYRDAVKIGLKLIETIDDQKITDYKNLKRKEAWQKTVRDFILGVLTGLIASIIYGNWSTIVAFFRNWI